MNVVGLNAVVESLGVSNVERSDIIAGFIAAHVGVSSSGKSEYCRCKLCILGRIHFDLGLGILRAGLRVDGCVVSIWLTDLKVKGHLYVSLRRAFIATQRALALAFAD